MHRELHRYVDPFIAVNGPGDCLCGPYLPHALVRLSPDCLDPHTSGYKSTTPITHFSHTHVYGTGGGGRHGNIGVTPAVGPAFFRQYAYDRSGETAAPGYYAVTLHPGEIRVELTTTPRVGVHRYTFPADTEAQVLINSGTVLQILAAAESEMARCIGGFVEFISETEVVGRGDLRGGWGHRFPYSVFFYARFSAPAVRRQTANATGPARAGWGEDCLATDGAQSMALASFGKIRQLELRVGISLVSVAKARASVEREAAGKDFDTIRAEAVAVWERMLSRIRVTGGTEEQKRIFYTSFTRLVCMPADLGIDDENPLWISGVRQFTDFMCLWDSVRNANSLITLFDPEFEAAILNAMLDVADHIGWLPDAWISGHSARIQGGSSADILFCEAALKGLPGIDYAKALRQMRKNGEVESPDPWLYGRYLPEYRDRGFLSDNIPESVSRQLEYAYQDWCIGRLAAHLGQADVAQRYRASAGKLWNLWCDEVKGFAPKCADGSWHRPFDRDAHHVFFYEGSSRQWSFNTQADFPGLVAHHGGAEAFVRHLDEFFDGGFYNSKETMLHIPYLYIYAGQPARTAQRVRECMAKFFRATRDGLSDGEDMGCQSAFYMCSAMGLYPVMGQDLYLLSSPVFARTEINLPASGQTLVIEAPNAGPDAPFVQSATLNGQPLDRAWVRHHEIVNGAVLRFELGARPSAWGTRDLPRA